MARTYSGVLAGLLDPAETLYAGYDDAPQCQGDWSHSHAVLRTVLAICSGRHVRLRRKILNATSDEVPGEITGLVVGGSSNADGTIVLGIESHELGGVGVNITNPNDWAWEVLRDG